MIDHLAIARQRFESDEYANLLGIRLDELTEDTIRMHMKLTGTMLNFYGRPHGAVVYALADAAFAVLGNNSNNISVALDCSITYHASPEPGSILVVEGKTLSKSRRTASYVFTVYEYRENLKVLTATMKSVSYRTGKPIDQDS